MNKIIITFFAIFVLFGCAEDEKNQSLQLLYPLDNNTGGDNSTDGDNNNDDNTSPEIDNKPIANFDFVVNGNIVTFTDKSTDDYGITKWEWNFGDNNTSNKQNPTHTYQNSGTYDVMLKVYTEDNISHYTVEQITIE